MSAVLIIMFVVIIVLAVLLTLVVLAQNPKGGGLSSTFGGGGTSQLMGVKRTNDLLEKVTWGIAVSIMVLAVSSGFIVNSADRSDQLPSSVNVERASGALPNLGAPGEGLVDPDAEVADEDLLPMDSTNPF